MKSVVVLFLIVVLHGFSLAQSQLAHLYQGPMPFETDPTLKDDIGVYVEPLDSATVSFGIVYDQIKDGAQFGAEAGGWRINQGSDYTVAVKIITIDKKENDVQSFKIDVAAGMMNSLKITNGTGGLIVSKSIDISRNNPIKLFSTVSQLVTRVSQRLRQDSIRRNFQMNRRVEIYRGGNEQ